MNFLQSLKVYFSIRNWELWHEKVLRVTELAKFLSVWVPGTSMFAIEETAKLAKADMATMMVCEFPELRGIMGRHYYLMEEGSDEVIAEAIEQHHMPVVGTDFVPSNRIALALSLADKIDTLVGFFIIGEKPSGSKDPLGLRRTALAIVRCVIEGKLNNLPLLMLLDKATKLYNPALFRHRIRDKILKREENFDKSSRDLVLDNLHDFFSSRLKNMLYDEGVPADIVNAACVLDKSNQSIVEVVRKTAVVGKFLSSDEGRFALSVYKRAAHMITKSAVGTVVTCKYNASLPREEVESALLHTLRETRGKIKKYLKVGKYRKCFYNPEAASIGYK